MLDVFPAKGDIRGFTDDGNFYVGFINSELVAALTAVNTAVNRGRRFVQDDLT